MGCDTDDTRSETAVAHTASARAVPVSKSMTSLAPNHSDPEPQPLTHPACSLAEQGMKPSLDPTPRDNKLEQVGYMEPHPNNNHRPHVFSDTFPRTLVVFRPDRFRGRPLHIDENGLVQFGDATKQLSEEQIRSILRAFRGVDAPRTVDDTLALNCTHYQTFAPYAESTKPVQVLLNQLRDEILNEYEYSLEYDGVSKVAEWAHNTSLSELEERTHAVLPDAEYPPVKISRRLGEMLDPDSTSYQRLWSENGELFVVHSRGTSEHPIHRVNAKSCPHGLGCLRLSKSVPSSSLNGEPIELTLEQIFELGVGPWKEDSAKFVVTPNQVLENVRLRYRAKTPSTK